MTHEELEAAFQNLQTRYNQFEDDLTTRTDNQREELYDFQDRLDTLAAMLDDHYEHFLTRTDDIMNRYSQFRRDFEESLDEGPSVSTISQFIEYLIRRLQEHDTITIPQIIAILGEVRRGVPREDDPPINAMTDVGAMPSGRTVRLGDVVYRQNEEGDWTNLVPLEYDEDDPF